MKKPEPRMEYAPNPEVLRQQLMTAKDRIVILEAQLGALGAKPKKVGAELTRLERVADALAVRRRFSDR